MLVLYTMDNCPFCEVMKGKLDSWSVKYEVRNVSYDDEAKNFLKVNGYKTVPQIFLGEFNVNAGLDTREFTEKELYHRLDVFLEQYPQEMK